MTLITEAFKQDIVIVSSDSSTTISYIQFFLDSSTAISYIYPVSVVVGIYSSDFSG